MRAGRRGYGPATSANDRGQDEYERRSQRRQSGAGRYHDEGDLAHAHGAMAHDEAAAPELRDERGGGRQAEIDADPGRIDAQIRDDRRRDHCGQGSAERDEGLLQEHRPEGEEELIHRSMVCVSQSRAAALASWSVS